jgi:hypothetical protein
LSITKKTLYDFQKNPVLRNPWIIQSGGRNLDKFGISCSYVATIIICCPVHSPERR